MSPIKENTWERQQLSLQEEACRKSPAVSDLKNQLLGSNQGWFVVFPTKGERMAPSLLDRGSFQKYDLSDNTYLQQAKGETDRDKTLNLAATYPEHYSACYGYRLVATRKIPFWIADFWCINLDDDTILSLNSTSSKDRFYGVELDRSLTAKLTALSSSESTSKHKPEGKGARGTFLSAFMTELASSPGAVSDFIAGNQEGFQKAMDDIKDRMSAGMEKGK